MEDEFEGVRRVEGMQQMSFTFRCVVEYGTESGGGWGLGIGDNMREEKVRAFG